MSLIHQSLELLKAFRLRPFDSTTATGRAKERLRRLVLTVAGSLLAKGCSLAGHLVSVPLTVNYLGEERYGLWMTITSVVALLGFADFGIGNGLLNAVAEADGSRDRRAGAEAVSSAFFMVLVIAAATLLLLWASYASIPWAGVFNVTNANAVAEAGPAAAVFFSCFALNLIGGVVVKTQFGLQEGFTNNLWNALGSVVGFIGILVVIHLEAGLPWLVLSMSGAPALANAANGVVLFGFKRPWLAPRISLANRKKAYALFRVGVLFFLLQIVMATAFASDNIVITQLLGPTEVARYAIPMRLFSILISLVSIAVTPFWPAYGEAVAAGDIAWVKRTIKRSVWFSFAVTFLPAMVLVAVGKQIVDWWVGPTISPSFALLSGMGLWSVLLTTAGACSMFLNGINRIGFQVVTAMLMGVAALAGKIILGGRIGIAGIIWGTIAGYFLFTVIPFAVHLPREVRRLEARFQAQDLDSRRDD